MVHGTVARALVPVRSSLSDRSRPNEKPDHASALTCQDRKRTAPVVAEMLHTLHAYF